METEKLYDGDTFTMPYRDYLIKLKSASGKKSAARTYTIYAYISTKGAKNAFKTISARQATYANNGTIVRKPPTGKTATPMTGQGTPFIPP